VRLYLDLEFTKSYDIPREAIVRRERLAAAQSSLGVDSSSVTVRAGTLLKLRRSAARPVEYEFLAGDFTAAGSFVVIPAYAVPARRRILSVQPCFTGLHEESICPTDCVMQCPQSEVLPCPGGGDPFRF
jgi:hypothetical protein